jgi:hypothetical protein
VFPVRAAGPAGRQLLLEDRGAVLEDPQDDVGVVVVGGIGGVPVVLPDDRDPAGPVAGDGGAVLIAGRDAVRGRPADRGRGERRRDERGHEGSMLTS